MRWKLAVPVLMLLIVLLLAGCRNPQLFEKTFTLEDFEQEPNQTWYIPGVRGQDELEVTLYSNPSTGYAWRIARADERGILEKAGSPVFNPPEGNMVGAAGTETWTFKIKERGAGFVIMEYIREFGDEEPLWTLEIVVE